MQVTEPINDVADEVPILLPWMPSRSHVHVAIIEGVCVNKAQFREHREQQKTTTLDVANTMMANVTVPLKSPSSMMLSTCELTRSYCWARKRDHWYHQVCIMLMKLTNVAKRFIASESLNGMRRLSIAVRDSWVLAKSQY